MYKVYLDDEFIYGVTSFEDESGRDISIYDGVGQGNFPVPESQDLHKWSLECELSEVNDMNHKEWKKASEIFKHLEKILGQKESVRLVVTSAYTNLSELVFLEKYSKSEKVNGIFDVQMSFVQYKAASARTEDVPYVERPGKIPVPPKAVVKNAYKTEKKYTGKTPVAGEEKIQYRGSGIMAVIGNQQTNVFDEMRIYWDSNQRALDDWDAKVAKERTKQTFNAARDARQEYKVKFLKK